MKNIKKQFEYDLPDDIYYQTNELKKTASLTYIGPETIYAVMDLETNKLTGDVITEEVYDTFNASDETRHASKIDCLKNPLLCALITDEIDTSSIKEITESIPGIDLPYVRDDPVLPNETYELTDIVINSTVNAIKPPIPWKSPPISWPEAIAHRNIQLRAYDNKLSIDLPDKLYNRVLEYKQFLRDFPEIVGASWTIAIDNAGTGYKIDDRLLISDPVYKNNSQASDIVVKVTDVDVNGGITQIKHSSAHAYDYHPLAGEYIDVYFTSNSQQGSGATLTMRKVATVDPWKINIQEPPLG